MLRNLIFLGRVVLFATLTIAPSLSDPLGTEFGFSIRESVKKDPRVVKIGPHPCGDYAVARVTTLPSVDTKGYLLPDKVVEVDAQNKTLRRWAKPLDSQVLGVQGDRILIEEIEAKKVYWIESSGAFKLQPTQIRAKKPEFISQVMNHPEFKKSDYAGLWNFQDLKTGKMHRVIYEGNCT